MTFFLRLMPKSLSSHLERYQNLNSILENALWLFGDKIVRAVVNLWVSAWFARYLGPHDFGVFYYAFAFITLLTPLINSGVEEIMVRDVVAHPEKKSVILGSAFFIKILGMIAMALGSLIGIWILRPGDKQALVLVMIFAFGTSFRVLEILENWFQSQVQSKFAVLSKNFAFFITTGLRIFGLITKKDIYFFAWAWSVEMILGVVFFTIFYHAQGQSFKKWKVEKAEVRYLFSQTWPLFLTAAMIYTYSRFDQILLRQMTSEHEVGVYGAALKLLEAWYFIPIALVASVTPSVVKSKKLNVIEYEGRIQALYDFMIWLSFAFAMCISFISPWLIQFLYGSKYQETALLFSLLAWLSLYTAFNIARFKWLMTEGYLTDCFQVEAMGVVINIVSNFLLIPKFGAKGAIFSSYISVTTSNLLGGLYLPQIRKSLKMYLRSMILPYRLLKLRVG